MTKKSGLNPGTAISPGQHGLLLSRPKVSAVVEVAVFAVEVVIVVVVVVLVSSSSSYCHLASACNSLQYLYSSGRKGQG